MSLRQIRGYWVFVAIDCGLAFATIFPIICIPPFLYLLVKYNFILNINFKREQVQNNDCWSLLAKFQSCFIIIFDFCLLFVGWIWMLVMVLDWVGKAAGKGQFQAIAHCKLYAGRCFPKTGSWIIGRTNFCNLFPT